MLWFIAQIPGGWGNAAKRDGVSESVGSNRGELTNAVSTRQANKCPTPKRRLRGVPILYPCRTNISFLAHRIEGPYPEGFETAMFGLGCFWGAERFYWQLDGVYTTAVGYAGGYTPNPYYEEVCSGRTGHNEVVFVVFDPEVVSYEELLAVFWEVHDPTQFMRQHNDIGTQYRSEIYVYDEMQRARGCGQPRQNTRAY